MWLVSLGCLLGCAGSGDAEAGDQAERYVRSALPAYMHDPTAKVASTHRERLTTEGLPAFQVTGKVDSARHGSKEFSILVSVDLNGSAAPHCVMTGLTTKG